MDLGKTNFLALAIGRCIALLINPVKSAGGRGCVHMEAHGWDGTPAGL
jgi:hypothetical protein